MTTDRFDEIGRLEDELVHAFGELTPHWEVRGEDPVLIIQCGSASIELIPLAGGRFKLASEVNASDVGPILALLTGKATLVHPLSPAPTPAPAIPAAAHERRTRSRRLTAMVG